MGRKLFVEVCDASDLMPKDGRGSASPYCIIDYDGQRRKTEMKSKDLQPIWNRRYEFEVADAATMEYEMLEITVFSEKKSVFHRPSFLGRVRIPGHTFVKAGEEVIMYYQLQRRSFFSNIKGALGLKVWYSDEADEVPAPASDDPPPPDNSAANPASDPPAAEVLKADPPSPDQPSTEGDDPPPPPPPAPPAPVQDSSSAPATEAPPSTDPPATETPPAATPPGDASEPAMAAHASVETESRRSVSGEAREARIERMLKSQPSLVHPAEYVLKETKPAIARSSAKARAPTYELVETMHYLFVRVVKARLHAAAENCKPYMRIEMGSATARTRAEPRSLNPEWHEVFAFWRDRDGGPVLEISAWDEAGDECLGSIAFDPQEIPKRVPPDSPLASQWYRLEESRRQVGGRTIRGDAMLAVWIGTQADEAFTQAWQSDSGGYASTCRAKVYISPKLWYLRVSVMEAQDVYGVETTKTPSLIATLRLGFQKQKTRPSLKRSSSPHWNEDLLFVAAEPFEDDLIVALEDQGGAGDGASAGAGENVEMGAVRIALSSIQRRVDIRPVASRWFNLQQEREAGSETEDHPFHGRVHLRLCFEGGYHVIDETIHHRSCVLPSAKQLWRASIGLLEVGIIRAKDLLPMKTQGGRGITDAYCVAKYGSKWVRTRTIVDTFNPRWNEPYAWEVYDPCTVVTISVIDNGNATIGSSDTQQISKDVKIGKVRIRLSTLESNRIYTNRHPLLTLHSSGVKKMGEIELAVRFSTSSKLDTLQLYTQPLLPKIHYLHPLGAQQVEMLRSCAVQLLAGRMARSEPQLRPEVVQFVMESECQSWSLRRSKVNYYRILNLLSAPFAVLAWFDGIRKWKNSVTTLLVHLLFFVLVRFPELILPTFFLYISIIGLWHYRHRFRCPPCIDPKLSLADQVDPDELDEEFDPIPTKQSPEIVRVRYDRLRMVAARVQKVLGDVATQGERVVGLFSWRDPRATAIAIAVCMLIALLLYVTPMRVAVLLLGLYMMRHPRLRQPTPPKSMNFFRRLPSLADLIL